MPKLTKEQEQIVKQWAAEGANLNEIQDRLNREHEINLTYLDARLLVIELGLNLQEKKKDAPPAEKKEAPPAPAAAADDIADEATEGGIPPAQAPAGGGSVKIVIDQIAIPGNAVSGKVTFSDGKTASWYLNQMGQLGMNAPEPGYKPPPADIPVFQRDLDVALQRAGF